MTVEFKPGIPAPLDPGFQPAALASRDYRRTATVSLVIGLEREAGLLSRYETVVRDDDSAATFRYVERLIKFLLWARGGWKIHFGGPRALGDRLRHCYSPAGERAFDVDLMQRVYERPFTVEVMAAADVSPARESATAVGGHFDGCRIGFDLGASDYKVAAVKDGTAVYSDEFPWNPRVEADPAYHYDHINRGLKQAAAHLPRVDAIGGSSAGVIVQNQIMVASLFRSVPAEPFARAVKPLFRRLGQEWGVPFEVANDGDVTALAGGISLQTKAVLGVAMGSSEAAGFLDGHGRITGWLNELAFAPVDFNPQAPADEWSGDRGVGALYFSQQAVNKLLPAAGITLPDGMGLPDRLKAVQDLLAKGDARAANIFATIGVYLGYSVAHYADYYDCCHLLTLGRVTSGAAGDIILERARTVLGREFPEIAARIALHVPDEKSKRVGQAVAAASLPALAK